MARTLGDTGEEYRLNAQLERLRLMKMPENEDDEWVRDDPPIKFAPCRRLV
jgi:hypothetical protein